MSSGCSSAPIQASRASITRGGDDMQRLVAVTAHHLHHALFAELTEVVLRLRHAIGTRHEDHRRAACGSCLRRSACRPSDPRRPLPDPAFRIFSPFHVRHQRRELPGVRVGQLRRGRVVVGQEQGRVLLGLRKLQEEMPVEQEERMRPGGLKELVAVSATYVSSRLASSSCETVDSL